MLLLTKPDQDSIRAFLHSQEDKKFSYAHVGASRSAAPAGYTVDHNWIQLGQGRADFERAVKAIRDWKMFDMDWIELCWPQTPIETGAGVAVLVSHLGFWSLNACRIVYVIEEQGACERYGFAYGTLPEHAERGEERFTVEFQAADQGVWYDLYAFSRPGAMASLAYPFTRTLQKRFARDSKNAMRKAVEFGR
jgi:uncharacterized protein (UPF0548 family)